LASFFASKTEKSHGLIEAEYGIPYSTVGRQARQRPAFKNTANVEMLWRHFSVNNCQLYNEGTE